MEGGRSSSAFVRARPRPNKQSIVRVRPHPILRNILMLPAHVIRLLQSAFPAQPIGDFAATTGGFSNLTAIATIGAQRCVIKAATATLKRDDVGREAALLRLLQNSDLLTPTLLALIEDEAWTIAV